MDVFKRLQKEESPLMLLTLKYGKSINKKHTDIDYLSDSDMDHAYRNAFALIFPSYFEGFGYPPIEALACGTPTIASNVTSVPEILGDAGLYFSPFYPADLYRATSRMFHKPSIPIFQAKRGFDSATTESNAARL